MNVYECLSRDIQFDPETYGRVWAVIYAPTRGRAKSLFYRHGSKEYWLFEWTDIASVKLLAKDVDHEEYVDNKYPEGIGYETEVG